MNKIIYNPNLAKNYNTYHQRDDFQIDCIKRLLDLNINTRVLDVGCGSGRLLIPLVDICPLISGVEYSENMVNELKNKIQSDHQGLVFLGDYHDFLINNSLEYDCAYFSYSLHQINPNKSTQLQILKDSFAKLKAKRILLITASRSQFSESILNLNSPRLDEIDQERFLFKDEIESWFIIESYIEETIYSYIQKSKLIDLIDNRYISTLQLLTEDELIELKDNINSRYGETIRYPDYYTYITLINE